MVPMSRSTASGVVRGLVLTITTACLLPPGCAKTDEMSVADSAAGERSVAVEPAPSVMPVVPTSDDPPPATPVAEPAPSDWPVRTDHMWVTRPIRAPRVEFGTFQSAAAQTTVSYHIFRPKAHDTEPTRRFPVVYWLHGLSGGLDAIPRVASIYDAAIEAGAAPPFIVVFVNGLRGGMYCNWQDGSVPMETIIVDELVPHIDATERTIATRDGRMLEGFSMGGYGAARLGLAHPGRFGAISMLGAGPLQPELVDTPRANDPTRLRLLERVYGGDQAYFRAQSPWAIAAENADRITHGTRQLLIRQAVGDRDETLRDNRRFHEHLTELGIAHEFIELPGVAHNPLATIRALGDGMWSFHREAFAEARLAAGAAR